MNVAPWRSSNISPEWKIILACSRTRFTDVHRNRVREMAQSHPDWDELLAKAARHCVDAMLNCHLPDAAGDLVPQNALVAVRETSRLTGRRSLFMVGQLIDLVTRFQKAGLPVIPYKGPTLAGMAYGNAALRPAADLDFVLPQRDVLSAFEVLIDAGFDPALNPTVERDRRLIESGHAGQYYFQAEGGSVEVELHTEKTMRYLPAPLDWDAVGRRLRTVRVGGREVQTFSFEDTILLLCVHGTKHFWGRLGWICDIAELVQVPGGMDWELSERLAKDMGCRRMWLLGLALANEVLEAPVPAPILQAIQEDRSVVALSRGIQTKLLSGSNMSPGMAQRMWFRLKGYESFAQAARQAWHMATLPTEDDWSLYQLPEWAEPLYAVLRPLRLLRGYGLGLREKPMADLSFFTPSNFEAIDELLRFAATQKDDVVYDLGCGNGRIVVTAAKQFGVRAVGIDIDPQRIAEAREYARQNGVEHLVEFRQEDARTTDLSSATVVTLYLELPGILALAGKLRRELRAGARIVTREYPFPGWTPSEIRNFRLASGRPSRLFLWHIGKRTEAALEELTTPVGVASSI